jgi:hypothetical protein
VAILEECRRVRKPLTPHTCLLSPLTFEALSPLLITPRIFFSSRDTSMTSACNSGVEK